MRQSRNTPAGAVLGHERPLTARSVVASTLLGMQPPELSGRLVVRSGELFGISEGTTRVALSRMVAAGELTAADGRYRLSGRLLERQARQDRSRRPRLRQWSGEWRTAVVTAEGRNATQRGELRGLLGSLRFGELREGVWMRPDNLDEPPPADAGPLGQCTWLRSRVDAGATDLAARLWDLAGWADRAGELRAALGATIGSLERGETDALAPCFVLSAAVLRHFQADPLLPTELLPRAWPGRALREDYDAYDGAFRAVWRAWLRRQRP